MQDISILLTVETNNRVITFKLLNAERERERYIRQIHYDITIWNGRHCEII